jgi:hypothetical protein
MIQIFGLETRVLPWIMTPHAEGLTDTCPSDISVHAGNDEYTAATHCGRLPVTLCNNEGVELYDAAFPEMHLVPKAPYNIISITQCMENGWRLGGNNVQGIILERARHKMCFDIRIETKKGVLWVGCMKRYNTEQMGIGLATGPQLTGQMAHGRLGRMSEDSTTKAAKALDWSLVPGNVSPCEDCAIGKGRQKNVPKDTGSLIATMESSRAYLDCTSFKDKHTQKVGDVCKLIVLYPSQLKITDTYQSKILKGISGLYIIQRQTHSSIFDLYVSVIFS